MSFKNLCFAALPFTLLLSGTAMADNVAIHYVKAKKHVVVYASPGKKKYSFGCTERSTVGKRSKVSVVCSASDFKHSRFECQSSDKNFIRLVRQLKNVRMVTLYSKDKKSMWNKGEKRPLASGKYAACSQIEVVHGL